MSALAGTLEAFFTERLVKQRQASPHTIAAYRDTWRLLLAFVAERLRKQPHHLEISDLDASVVGAFLDHLERERDNSIRTRNARLAAIRSAYRYAAMRHPEYAATIERVLAIPPKRTQKRLMTFLTAEEVEALLAAPDRGTWTGRRDHCLLTLAIQTGLRASELLGLCCNDVFFGTGAYVQCLGKGRKHRVTPLTSHTVTALRNWLKERGDEQGQPLYPKRTSGRLSRDALERRLAKYAATAAQQCPSLHSKRITAHVLRHTAAMRLLRAGVDLSVIALWLGHEQLETTQTYLEADLVLKEQALARTRPPDTKPGRFKPPDPLLAFLEAL